MPKRYQATSANVEDYWQLFVNRRAYVLQSMRPHAESGRYYYFRPKAGKNGEAPSLAAETVRRHLEGDLTIGVYAMSPATQRCKWIAMDGDYKDSLKHLCELQWELQQQKVEAALEQSRRGAHLWIFGEQPLLARQCRLLISGLAQKLGIPVKGAGTAEGIEIFPKRDELKDGDFGNAIRGPLGIHRTIQRAVLVLRRRLQPLRSTGIPQTGDETVRGATRSSAPEAGTADRRGEEGNQANSTLAVPGTTKAVSHFGPSPGTAEDGEKLDHAMPFMRRGGTRQERRQPGDLG